MACYAGCWGSVRELDTVRLHPQTETRLAKLRKKALLEVVNDVAGHPLSSGGDESAAQRVCLELKLLDSDPKTELRYVKEALDH